MISPSDKQEVIVDSNYTFQEAIAGTKAPDTIINQLVLLDVYYYDFDDKMHRGQIVVNKSVSQETKAIFEHIFQVKFPLKSVIPIVHFDWDDDLSMQENNTSSFNYRVVTGSTQLSKHATGEALDFNPWQNPYIKGDITLPQGAVYDVTKVGTIDETTSLYQHLCDWKWTWGGNWQSLKDYQHFEK